MKALIYAYDGWRETDGERMPNGDLLVGHVLYSPRQWVDLEKVLKLAPSLGAGEGNGCCTAAAQLEALSKRMNTPIAELKDVAAVELENARLTKESDSLHGALCLLLEAFGIKPDADKYQVQTLEAINRLARITNQREAARVECEGWQEDAARFARNEEFYRGLLVQIGETFGPPAYTSDDGSVQEDVLCLKVPELVAELKTTLKDSQYDNGCLRHEKHQSMVNNGRLMEENDRLQSRLAAAEGLIQTIRDCATNNLDEFNDMGVRVDEMTERELGIFRVAAAYAGALNAIQGWTMTAVAKAAQGEREAGEDGR